MMKVLIFAQLLAATYALPRWHQGRLVYDHGKVEESVQADTVDKFFEQRVDHFDRQINSTFLQRYFVNETYWNGDENAPIFLCVGGEGPPLDRSVLVASVHCNDMVELAPQHGALMLALEHRYYGPSNPFRQDYSTKNLQWLNSEQALGDIAHFVSFVSTKYNLKDTNRWITWGGSYPGMMAALARYRYPHLIYASVSSSAPLQAAVEMTGYNNVVAHSMSSTNVGGSDACLNAIVDGHATIGEQLQTAEGRRELESVFNVCTPGSLDDSNNQEVFAGDGVVYLPVQSNDPSCTTPYCDIASICVLMTDTTVGTPVQRLAALSKVQHSGTCVAANYEATLAAYSIPANPERVWLYQTCSEWGFYQTCNKGSRCPYTQGLHTIDFDFAICKAAFDIDSDAVVSQIKNTLSIYGGDNIQSSRIMFNNGEIDPWHANSVLKSPNAQEPTQWVPAASHHFWTHPSLPTDQPEVVAARQKIWVQVNAWLAK